MEYGMSEQPMTGEQPVTVEEERVLRLAAARAHAVGEAMREVMAEQAGEIVKRARAKLLAMGITVEDAEGPLA
jgi:hypothetical protein